MTCKTAAKMARNIIMKRTGLSSVEALELLNEILGVIYKADNKKAG